MGVVSATLISTIGMWEGNRYVPYDDVVGVITVCKGHTGPDVVRGKTYSKQECDAFLAKDIKRFQDGVLKCTNVPLTSYQFDAFTIFAYNVGVNAYCSSNTVLKPLNSGNYNAACDGLMKWVYADGKFVQGLYNRRAYERKMCRGELDAK